MKYSILFLSLCAGVLHAQTDFTHLSLDVTFNPAQGEVIGNVKLDFTAQYSTDSIFLDGINMEYQEVLLNTNEVNFGYNEKGIWLLADALKTSEKNQISIKYTCQPRKGIFFIGFNDSTGKARQQIWTQGQGIDHRHWIPHKDDQTDKVMVDLKITAQDVFQVMANGTLTEKSSLENGYTLWEFTMQKPMPSYLIALVVGKYDTVQTFSASGIPLTQYYYPERKQDYSLYYWQNEEIFNWLEQKIGVAYPWQNYKQAPVVNFQHGAMENTTATIWGDFFMADSLALPDRNYPYVNAHEMAHQWFGNYVTAKNSDHHWLHEGFATYYQWLIEEQLYGKEHFDWQRKLAADMIFEASAQDDYPLMSKNAGSSRFYQKGAWVLYMQQNRTDKFDLTIQNYLKKYAFGLVETDALQSAFEKETGESWDAFFDFWVKQPMDLHYSVEQRKLTKKLLILNVNTDKEAVKTEPISVLLAFKDGSTKTLALSAGEHKIDLTQTLLYWNANPNMEKLMQLTEDKPNEMWEAQFEANAGLSVDYEKANLQDNMLNRFDAVQHLEAKSSAKILQRVVENALEHFGIRAEALKKLLLYDYEKYVPLVRAELNKGNQPWQLVNFQKEAVKMLDDTSPETLEALANVRFGNSYALRETAIHKSVLFQIKEANNWLFDKRYAEQPGIDGQNVYITSLIYRYIIFKDAAARDTLIDRTSVSFDFLTRMNAIQALQAVGYFDAALLPHLFEGLFNTNRKLLRTARSALLFYAETAAHKKQIEGYIAENQSSWNDFQKTLAERTFDR